MKKALAIALSFGLLAGAMIGNAEAAKKKKKKVVKVERVVELAYDSPGVGVAVQGGATGYPIGFPSSQDMPTSGEERYVKVEIVDASGQKVNGSLAQSDQDGDMFVDDLGEPFCGATEEPIEFEPGTTVVGVYAHNGTCADGTPSIMTTGTVTLTFSNLP
ncbi:MAG TPA: hypothetical protein VJ927_10925 [Actinomycetota bacterium]|nr:hypothetical protein [Actinomycetota bacterium]